MSSRDLRNSVHTLAKKHHDSKIVADGPFIRVGCLVRDWRGWRHDFYYFTSNVHPLHGILCCDPVHPLTRSERIMMEVTTLLYNYWQAHEYQIFKNGGGQLPLIPD